MVVRYDLYQNGIIVSNSLVREYRVDNLEPYSLHIFRVAACTVQGCGFSNQVEAHTMESPPRGIVVLSVAVTTPRSVNATWTAPDRPNGKLFYDVYFEGLFYTNPGHPMAFLSLIYVYHLVKNRTHDINILLVNSDSLRSEM